jgi:hypothetical protein
MWGTAGKLWRRRLIRAEFALGALGCTAVGLLLLVSASGFWVFVGAWLVGAGINYVPLAVYAQLLSRPGGLEAELRDLDLRRELSRNRALEDAIPVESFDHWDGDRGARRTAPTSGPATMR